MSLAKNAASMAVELRSILARWGKKSLVCSGTGMMLVISTPIFFNRGVHASKCDWPQA